jgi:hypothetical protein
MASRAVWILIGLAAACRTNPHADDLHVFAHPSWGPYTSIADIASVAPALEVTGASELHDTVATKLAADGVGKTGHVHIELAMAPSGDLAIRLAAAWGVAAGKYQVRATMTGQLRGEAGGTRLATEIEKILVPPKHIVVPSAPANPIAVAAGAHMQCSLHSDGTVRCWGDAKRLGPVPAPIAGVTDAVELAVGDQLGCVRRADGTAACWDPAAWVADATELGARTVCGVTGLHAITDGCGLGAGGDVACWTAADFGDCAKLQHVHVAGDVVQLRRDGASTCTLDAHHRASCWTATSSPADVPALAGATALASSVDDTICGVLPGRVRCGTSDHAIAEVVQASGDLARTGSGQLVTLDGAAVAGLDRASDIAVATTGTACAIGMAGDVWCRDGRKPFARVVYAAP